ncbi:hypothetical protein Tco_1329452 [Tanacetum coccineum]
MTSFEQTDTTEGRSKVRKEGFEEKPPYDQPITNPNPKNTSKSSFFSRLIYAVTCVFWRRNPAVTEAPLTDIETMLKKKTFTRYEIEHLTTYRYEIDEGDKANISKNSLVLRLKESKSGPLNKHAEERENLHDVISIPRAFQEDIVSPVELARARSRGRTAMYRMARSPYYRGPSTLSKKVKWKKMVSLSGKRRSSVQDDLGYGGPMRRIWQKAKRCSQGSSLSKHKSGILFSAQRLLLSSEPKQKASKAIVKNGEISMRNSGYAFVPTVSTQMASKILEHLERTIPKEKPSFIQHWLEINEVGY